MSKFTDEYDTKRRLRSEISNMKYKLEQRYPLEAKYGSRANLWSMGLMDGVISRELYEAAREYYGKLWTYVGD